jgi:hypothetical protein
MKMILTFVLCLLSLTLTAPPFEVINIPRGEVINPYERIIKAVVQVESSGNVYAFNKHEGAYGAFQVRKCRLDDYNLKTGSKYVLTDMFDYVISEKIFLYYVTQYDYRDIKGICQSWNGKSLHNHYYQKIKAVL